MGFEVADKMGVEELCAVIKVQLEQHEGQGFFNLADALSRGMASPVPHGSHLRPAAVDVGGIQGPDDGSAERSPAQGHCVDLQGSPRTAISLCMAASHRPLSTAMSSVMSVDAVPRTALLEAFRRCPRSTLMAYLRSSPVVSQYSLSSRLRVSLPVRRE